MASVHYSGDMSHSIGLDIIWSVSCVKENIPVVLLFHKANIKKACIQ